MKKTKSILILLVILIFSYTIISITKKNNDNLETNQLNLESLETFNSLIENDNSIDIKYIEEATKKIFGSSKTSKYLEEIGHSVDHVKYSLSEQYEIDISKKHKASSKMSKRIQQSEKIRIDFMIIFYQAYITSIDTTIENVISENNKLIGSKIFTDWMSILHLNGNIDPVSVDALYIYSLFIDAMSYDGYTIKKIENIIDGKDGDTISNTMKIMESQRKLYKVHIDEAIRQFKDKSNV